MHLGHRGSPVLAVIGARVDRRVERASLLTARRWTVVVAVMALVVSGCTPRTGLVAGNVRGAEVGHVHDLSVDVGDGHLFVAAHGGIFRFGSSGLQRVGTRQDSVSLVAVGAHQFLAGGHSVAGARQAVGLGLVESLDAARSWTQVPRTAGADFHSLTQGFGRLYGYDARTGTLVAATGRSEAWTPVLRAVVSDLAAAPTWGDGRILAATESGTRLLQGEAVGAPLRTPEPFTLVGWPAAEMLIGVTMSGSVFRSDDLGQAWRRVGSVPGVVEALDTTTVNWYVATGEGIFTSTDLGVSWVQLV